MSYHTPRRPDTADRFLKYAGVAGILVALLLTLAVAQLTVLPSLVPSGYALATLVFTLAVVLVAVAAQRLVPSPTH